MAWFVDEERPLPALVLDGLGWGTVVGFTIGFLGGVPGIVIGTLVGAGLGLLVGLLAGLLLAGWQRVGTPGPVAVLGTLAPILVGLALLPSVLWGVPPDLGLLWLVIPAAGPLTADVVWRVRRWSPRRAARSGPRFVLTTRDCVLVIR